MSEERRLAVLRAIVEDYVQTREPVGSKALVERHALGVSPATIRNDMASLEEEGLIAQPHTSAGRIPTDKGYRLFVDRLSTVKPLSSPEKKAIQTLLDGAVDLDDVVDRTVRLLAQLTHQVAVVQYPSLTRSTVRHVELVPLGGGRLLVVLITNTGRVEQRFVDVGHDPAEAILTELRNRLNGAVAGRRLTEVRALVADLPAGFAAEERPLVRVVLDALEDTLAVEREERIVLAGTANLARVGHRLRRLHRAGAGGARGAGGAAQAAHRDGRGHRRHRRPDRPRAPARRAVRDGRRRQWLRWRGRGRRTPRRPRPDPDGLPHDDRRRPRRRPLRVPDPGVMSVPLSYGDR